MKYTYHCEQHGAFVCERSIIAPSTATEPCPHCGQSSLRHYKADIAPIIYNGQGFHSTDYWKGNVGNQIADKKEWLNTNWSKHYNESPPPPDTKGTYDGR